jgi:hypothetical protein
MFKDSLALIITMPARNCAISIQIFLVVRIEEWKQNNQDDEDEDEEDGNARWLTNCPIAEFVALLMSQHL